MKISPGPLGAVAVAQHRECGALTTTTGHIQKFRIVIRTLVSDARPRQASIFHPSRMRPADAHRLALAGSAEKYRDIIRGLRFSARGDRSGRMPPTPCTRVHCRPK